MVAQVGIIGCGLVGKEVIHQLSLPALAPLFSIIALANSKHAAFAEPAAKLSGHELLKALPPSSAQLPASAPAGVSFQNSDPPAFVQTLAAAAKAQPTILIDCTSDLSVTELYPTAIAAGVSVVTPNKKGFSSSDKLWKSIVEAESKPDAGLVYLESTVGAGLPIISTLRDILKTGDQVSKIEGVFSGTMSYIFNEFAPPAAAAGTAPAFSEVVKVAKANGYTEPHPADDLSGSDVARKLTILSRLVGLAPSSLKPLPSLPEGYASLATESLIPSELEGIASGDEFVSKLGAHDKHFDEMRAQAAAEGKVLRYVGVIDREAGVVKCGLEKYPNEHPFASALSGSDNIISFHTERYSARPLIVQGSGAGAAVTAAGVVGDVIKVAERSGLRIHL